MKRVKAVVALRDTELGSAEPGLGDLVPTWWVSSKLTSGESGMEPLILRFKHLAR